MSHGTAGFRLAVRLVCGADPLKPWTPVVRKAPSRLVVWGILSWHGLGPLVHLNLLLTIA